MLSSVKLSVQENRCICSIVITILYFSLTLPSSLKFETNAVRYIPSVDGDAEEATLSETGAAQAIFSFPLAW